MSHWRPPQPDPYVGLADAAAHEQAVRERAREREVRARAAEVAEWVGTLRDLAEACIEVTVRGRSGRTHRGRLVAVAEDHVALQLPAGQLVAVAIDALTSVRPEPGRGGAPAMGDRDRAQDRTLLEVLDRLVAERRRVAMCLEGSPDVLQGELDAVGEDVVTLRLDGQGHDPVYVRAAAVLEVVIDPV